MRLCEPRHNKKGDDSVCSCLFGPAFLKILVSTALLLCVHNLYAADFSAPIILLPFAKPLYNDSRAYSIVIRVTDENGVDEVKIHYRGIGSNGSYTIMTLQPTDDPDIYSTDISKEFIIKPGIEYYIEARDVANNISQEPFAEAPRQIYFTKSPLSKEDNKITSKTNWWWVALSIVTTGIIAAKINKDDDEVTAAAKEQDATLILVSPNPDSN